MDKYIYEVICDENTSSEKMQETFDGLNKILAWGEQTVFHPLEIINNRIYMKCVYDDARFVFDTLKIFIKFLTDVDVRNVCNVTRRYEEKKQLEIDKEYLKRNKNISYPIPHLQKSHEEMGITPKKLYEWALKYGIENAPIISYTQGLVPYHKHQAWIDFKRKSGNLEVEGITII